MKNHDAGGPLTQRIVVGKRFNALLIPLLRALFTFNVPFLSILIVEFLQ